MIALAEFDERDDDKSVNYYHYCRDHHGNMVPTGTARRNGRAVPVFPRDVTEPYWLPADESTPDYYELVEELCQNLNSKESRRWLLAIRDDRNNSEIAEAEGVTRQAIIDGFHRMAVKNPYVAIWLDHKHRRNQHE
jgi:hypothetical protein